MSPGFAAAADPSRGDVWMVEFDPVRGHEQGGSRPALVVSADLFNKGAAGLVIVAPLTSRAKHVNTHVPVEPPEGGLSVRSFVKCEDIRSVSIERVGRRLGAVTDETLDLVEDRLRILLDL